jgi:hypothetical protein
MIDRNMIGTRGEMIFFIAISHFYEERPLFRPVLLGEKWPIADLMVELIDEPGMTFLVQIKTSTRGYTQDRSRLFISADREELQKLANAPLPTYLIGVDEPGQHVYLTAVLGDVATGRTSISVDHSAKDATVHQRLYTEVKEFWLGVRERRPWTHSQFAEAESRASGND